MSDSIREKIEKNPVIFFLSVMITGFLAGIGAYEGILNISKLQVLSQSDINKKDDDLKRLDEKNKELEFMINALNDKINNDYSLINKKTNIDKPSERKEKPDNKPDNRSNVVIPDKPITTKKPEDSTKVDVSAQLVSKDKNNATSDKMVKTTFGTVNIYEIPSLDGKIIFSVSRNTRLLFIQLGGDNGWTKIKANDGRIGWVESKRIIFE